MSTSICIWKRDLNNLYHTQCGQVNPPQYGFEGDPLFCSSCKKLIQVEIPLSDRLRDFCIWKRTDNQSFSSSCGKHFQQILGDDCSECSKPLLLEVKEISTCIWTESENGPYQTNCGREFYFEDGTVEEHKFLWCPFCGGDIKVTKEENLHEDN